MFAPTGIVRSIAGSGATPTNSNANITVGSTERDGQTRQIPDARSFRPFDRENARLQPIRLESCGDLWFLSLDDNGVSLREFLGPQFDLVNQNFASPWQQVWSYETTYQTNWKVPIENSLESYHIPCVHAKTFGDYPEEEEIVHQLDERFTSFQSLNAQSWLMRLQQRLIRRLGGTPNDTYQHLHCHPHLLFTRIDELYRLLQFVLPTSPTTAKSWLRFYTLRGESPGLYQRLIFKVLARLGIGVTKRVLHEDLRILNSVQQGLAASPHPGAIGRREERLYAFQKYVADATSTSEKHTARLA